MVEDAIENRASKVVLDPGISRATSCHVTAEASGTRHVELEALWTYVFAPSDVHFRCQRTCSVTRHQ